MTEEYEFYTPFKMLFISLSLGAQSTSNFTHSYNSPANSSCCSSGVPRNRVSLCVLLRRLRQGQRRLCASVGRGGSCPHCPCTDTLHVCAQWASTPAEQGLWATRGARPWSLGMARPAAGKWTISHTGHVDCSDLSANEQLVC